MAEHAGNDISSKRTIIKRRGSSGGIWFLGFIGALIYYVHVHAGTVWLVVVAVLKALVWPAYVVYDVLRFLHA